MRQSTGTSKGPMAKRKRTARRMRVGKETSWPLQKEWESLQFEKRVVLYDGR